MAVPTPTPTPPVDATGPIRFGVIGSGWRSGFFLRPAVTLPERFAAVGMVTRTAERGREVQAQWGVPTYRSAGELVAAQQPEFVVVSVPWAVAPGLTTQLVEPCAPTASWPAAAAASW